MKKRISVIFALFLVLSAYAQSADVITEVLESDEATFGQVCYLAAVQKNLIGEKDSYDSAVQKLFENKIIPSLEASDEPVPVIDIAYIYSQLWEIKGGLMYRLTKGSPRYVFKQLQADGVIDANLDPGAYVSGAKALSIYTACNKKYGNFDMSSVSMEAE